MDDFHRFFCQNSSCPDYGKRGVGNLRQAGWSGKKKRYRLLLCKTCRHRFSERKGTVFFRARLDDAKVVSILAHVAEGTGMRKTGRLEGVKEDAVIRLAKKAGQHAKALHDDLVTFSPSDPGGPVG